jgi:hypothetical protein
MILSFAILTCSSSKDSKPTANKKMNKTATESKINAALREVMENVAKVSEGASASSLSTSRVRVDQQGNLHCYIYLTQMTEDNIAAIKARITKFERVDETSKIIQGWLSPQQIDEIARLEFVKQITPPDYAYKF